MACITTCTFRDRNGGSHPRLKSVLRATSKDTCSPVFRPVRRLWTREQTDHVREGVAWCCYVATKTRETHSGKAPSISVSATAAFLLEDKVAFVTITMTCFCFGNLQQSNYLQTIRH